MTTPEILAPAGDLICLQAALDAGANAVYLGIGRLNMRSGASVNFSQKDLPEISARCRERSVKLYITLNTIVFEDELGEAEDIITFAKPFIDAFIVSDWGIIELCKKHSIPFHVSTQMSCSNSASARFLKSQGASRIVLARECSLSEVQKIIAEADIEVETFVHGAQCVAESGRCLMSQSIYGCSANRGECRQPCRRSYQIRAVDSDTLLPEENDAEFIVTPHTVLSAKDLCSIPFVDKLMAAGIASFKIEGRARNANYVKTVTAAYRKAVDSVIAGTFTEECKAELMDSVSKVFHREFGPGLFYGRTGDSFTKNEDSAATTIKKQVGIVLNYYAKAGIAQVRIQDNPIRPGDVIQIHGPTTGVQEFVLGEMRRDNDSVTIAEKGSWVTFATPKCRLHDKVFLVVAK